jgi:hypothetical protein
MGAVCSEVFSVSISCSPARRTREHGSGTREKAGARFEMAGRQARLLRYGGSVFAVANPEFGIFAKVRRLSEIVHRLLVKLRYLPREGSRSPYRDLLFDIERRMGPVEPDERRRTIN